MSEWEIWFDDPLGNRLTLIDHYISAKAVRVANHPGAFTLTLSSDYDAYLRPDAIIEIWRRPEGGSLKLFNAYFLRSWAFEDAGYVDQTNLSGEDGISLLQTRVVAYAAGTTEAGAEAEAADDLMKRLVRLNLTTDCSDTDRDLSPYGMTVAPNVTAAPVTTLGFSYRNLLDVFDDLAETSAKNGTDLYFDVVPTFASGGTVGWEFRTYTGQPGIDQTGADQVIFGRDWGNLTGARTAYDYTAEKTVVYTLGQGSDTDRVIEEVEDTTRSTLTPWARREVSYNASGQASTTDAYAAAGQAELQRLRPRMRFTGELVDTDFTRFQRDWDFGNRVIVTRRGQEYEALILAIEISMDGSGRETLRATFEVVE
jgi:hypothetical protein